MQTIFVSNIEPEEQPLELPSMGFEPKEKTETHNAQRQGQPGEEQPLETPRMEF